jgi:hypothetical protein
MQESGNPKTSLHDAGAAIAFGLEHLAGHVDELQTLLGELVSRAGLANNSDILQRAQMVDLLSQQLHRHARLVRRIGSFTPADVFLDEASSSELRALLAAGRAFEQGAQREGTGECRFF